MSGRMQESETPLGQWLRVNLRTITQLAETTNLAYRTAWLAVHGYKISYDSAKKIVSYIGIEHTEITIKSLCDAPSRSLIGSQNGEKEN